MIREEMMDRMSALEFSEWMALERMAYAPAESTPAPTAQTPQQIMDMFPVTKHKPPKPPIDDSFRMGHRRRRG